MRRLSAAFIALWFTISMVDTGWLHACEMHSPRPASEQPLAATVATAAIATTAPDTHSAHHAASHAPEAVEARPSDATAPSHESHQCDCLGACCAAQSAVAVVSCDLHELTRVGAPPVATPMVTRWTVASIDHRLPFATAPPTA
jgi:hypothetical protein